MLKNIFYKKDGDCYYKINNDLKRITKVENNEVSYLDYNDNISKIGSLKNVSMSTWKHIENSFFISRHFEWEYGGQKYRTTDKPIEWKKEGHAYKAKVFHNGKIWDIERNYNYFPRITLEKEEYVVPSREVILEKHNAKIKGKNTRKRNSIPKSSKWTDVKYCRHFEKIS